MQIKRIPLYERLDCLNGNQAAHPEYDSAVIRSMARMPIIQYLGDYDTFCDFQILTEVREDLPYQITAQVIAEQMWSQEDMDQIISFLAAPIVRLEEAYLRKNPALLPYSLLPYCKRRQAGRTRESLASRLEGAAVLAGPPYACHRMPIQRFFRGMSKLTGNFNLLFVYQRAIRPYAPGEGTLFRQAVYSINALPSPERNDLLYKILVEPFAALPTESECI